MNENNTEFKKWYSRFLLSSGDSKMTAEEAVKEAENTKKLLSDEDIFSECIKSSSCKFCKNDSDVKRAEGYGLTDIGIDSPAERENGIYGGKGGTVLPLVIPMCKKCRRNYIIVQYLPTIICFLIVLAALLITTNLNVQKSIFESESFVPMVMRPFVIFAVVTAIAILLDALIRRLLIKSLPTRFNVFEIPEFMGLKQEGWFRLHGNKHFCQVMFSEDLPEYMKEAQNITADNSSEAPEEESKENIEEQNDSDDKQ